MDTEAEDRGQPSRRGAAHPGPARPGGAGTLARLRALGARRGAGGDLVATTVRRAVRVALAASAGFYLGLYGLHQPVVALYALFGPVALAGLSRIPGSGRQRAATILRVLPAGWLLVTAGTLLAVTTWAAVAGMLVIGFVLALAAVAGPRPGGASPGLQLLYILPCFPPYAPQELGERLGGATLGVALLALAEALLLPDRPATGYRELLAKAVALAGRCAAESARHGRPLSAELRDRSSAAGQTLRLSGLPPAERPAGPGRRDRALSHAGGAARRLLMCLHDFPGVPADPGPGLARNTQAVLERVGDATTRAAAALRGGPPPDPAALEAATAEFTRRRALLAETAPGGLPTAVLARQAALVETAEAALTLVRAVAVATDGPLLSAELRAGSFWYSGLSARRLWWRRFTGHLSPRSVYFQNAVRISVGLAAARAVAGAVALPHGFWVMLAALTLTRTTAVQTRRTVRQALTGTLVGALAAAGLLAAIGENTGVYAAVLPFVMLATFCLGPTLGVGWAQALFTLTVATAFAQLAPTTWQLAEVRLLDVLTGSMIGLLCGLLAWPRGAQEELRRDISLVLDTVAATITSTASVVVNGPTDGPPPDRSVLHALTLAESAYAQFQSEPPDGRTDHPDWQAALISGHHALHGAQRLLHHRESPGTPAPGPRSGAWLVGYADGVAREYVLLADRLAHRPGRSDRTDWTDWTDWTRPDRTRADRTRADRRPVADAPPYADSRPDTPPAGLPLLFDAGSWLSGLAADLARIAPAAARPGPSG
ncbi:FUSC family protein [Kitasatospora kazusensis]